MTELTEGRIRRIVRFAVRKVAREFRERQEAEMDRREDGGPNLS